MARHRMAWMACAALAALLLASAGGAQGRAANFAVTGVITAIDTAKKTISVKGPNDDGGTFNVGGDTTIMSQTKKVGLGDLKKGWRVVLNGTSGLDGVTKTATYIEVVDTQ